MSADRRAVLAGLALLLVLTVVYPLINATVAQPLSIFVLPALLTAALGAWLPAVVVGAASLLAALIFGITGDFTVAGLTSRLVVVLAGGALGALGAVVRQRQAARIEALGDAILLREAFERDLAPPPHRPPGFEVVAHYRPAESRMRLGGDFYEAVDLGDGRLAVVIGDVCGHGPREAATGAALRAGWKAIALSGKHDPADWVEALHHAFFLDGRIDTFVTLCTGYLDAKARSARFVTAGHPAPVLVEPPPRPLALRVFPPLGLGLHANWSSTEQRWSGAPVLLYTDGLVENPRLENRRSRWGEDGLMGWLDRNAVERGALTRFGSALIQAATAGRERRDDVATLLIAGG